MSDNTLKSGLQQEILTVSDLLYQNNLGEGVKALPSLIQKLAGFSSELAQEDIPAYTNIMKNIMESMELKDYVLLADLLIFEVNPILDNY
ncbi:MAG: hypothetical protein IJ079_02170 [Lachnospiraceae bacterium]|nr:hypothetical protein [Lachnospiraceae bacterium]